MIRLSQGRVVGADWGDPVRTYVLAHLPRPAIWSTP
jgi:hypothetical protein